MPILYKIFFLALALAQTASAQQQLPTITQDEPQPRPARLITKTYDPKSQEYAFWSKHEDPDSERINKLAQTALQIQQLNDQLRNHEGVDPDRTANEAKLKSLTDYLNEQQNKDRKPIKVKFLKWTQQKNTNLITVTLYSDIKDAQYNRRIANIIETNWQFQTETENYQVKIDLKPLKGQPQDGAQITANAESTHAELGHAIRLGPAPLTENVLAHEFGHVLGFKDLYYRSYKKRGGTLEIMEVVPATSDIMGNPESGKIELRHFQELKKTIAHGK